MMRTKLLLGLMAASGLLLPGATAADLYKIDPAHTRVGFSVRHMGISNVRGIFDQLAGSIVLDGGKIKEASATIQVKSVNTGIQQRDNHLRTPDFFDAAKYPVITFKTKRVESDGSQARMVADFTMRGVTKELVLPVTVSGPIKDPQGNTRIGLEAKTNLNRRDYGLNFKGVLETGGLLVGDDVAIEINAEAIRQTAPDTAAR